jgi:FkbM family methyltransferase
MATTFVKKYIRQYLKSLSQEKRESLKLIQIGANDGIQDDPICNVINKYKISSDLIEPIPFYFDELTNNYKDSPWVKCHNLAISDTDGYQEMSWLRYNPDLPVWMKGLNTFDPLKNYLGTGHGGRNLSKDMRAEKEWEYVKNNIEKINVKTSTLNSFFKDNNIKKIDLYITDTEGYDGKIFNQLDLSLYSPKIILMETHSLGDEENAKIDQKLINNNYEILLKEHDTLAVKKE